MLWSYYANVNDTASIAVYLTDNDILDTGKVSWSEYKGMSEQFNQVVGKFVDPSSTALYQPRAYPMVRDSTYETNLGVKRRKTQDFEQIQDALLAQKLARLMLNQGQYQGEFTATFNYRALKAQAWSIVSFTSERFGWTKLFRVYRQAISSVGGGVPMTLREVHPSIWTAGSVVTPPTLGIGQRYDASKQISLTGLTVSGYTGTGADGTIQDGMVVAWSTPPANVRRTELQIKLTTDTFWQSYGPFKIDVASANLFPLLPNTQYNIRARHVSVNEVAGAWVTANFTVGNNSNVSFATIDAKANTFRQTTPPTTGTLGDYWTDIDDSNATYRHEGLGLFVGGTPITFNGNGTTFDAPWVSVLDQSVVNSLNQIATLNSSMAAVQASVTSISSDNVLSMAEKPEINRQYAVISAEYGTIQARGAAAGITTELSAYTSAYNSLIAYLATLTRWQDTAVDTPISGSTFNSSFQSYYSAKSALNAKIDQLASQTANWSGVTGTTGQPTGSDVATTVKSGGGVAPNNVATTALIAHSITVPIYVASSDTYTASTSWGANMKSPGAEINMGVATSGEYEVESFIDIDRNSIAWLAGDNDIWAEVYFQLINLSNGGSFGSGETPGSGGIGGQSSKFSDFKYIFVAGQSTILANTLRLRHTERISRPDLIGSTLGFECLFRFFATGLRTGQSFRYKSGGLTVREIKR